MTYLIVLAAIVLFIIVIWQIGKVLELVSVISGKKDGDADRGNNMIAFIFLTVGMIFLALTVWSFLEYKSYFLPEASSIHGIWIDDMTEITFIFTGIVFLITQIALFVFAYQYRNKKGKRAFYFTESHKLELVWTIIPTIVLTYLVWESTEAWWKIFPDEAPEDRIEVEVTGKQFQWIIRYPGADNQFGTRDYKKIVDGTNELGLIFSEPKAKDDLMTGDIYLPVNKPVEVHIRARDVLHSFYLPHFRVKMDAVPGIPTKFLFTPTKTTAEMRQELNNPDFNYELACAEMCGAGHFNMMKKVVVVTEEEYKNWLKEQPTYYSLVNTAENNKQ